MELHRAAIATLGTVANVHLSLVRCPIPSAKALSVYPQRTRWQRGRNPLSQGRPLRLTAVGALGQGPLVIKKSNLVWVSAVIFRTKLRH